MWGALFSGMSGASGSGGGGGGQNTTSGPRETSLGTSGFTFGNYNAAASGVEPWQLLLFLGLLAVLLFKVVK